MKKSVLAVFCAAMMLAGCGGAATEEAETTTQEVTQETTAEEAETAETVEKDEEMLTYLKELPAEIPVEAAAEQGFFTIENGAVKSGQENWDAFMKAAEAGEEASVVLCQYSANGGAMLDYLTHKAEGGYLLASDRSRDGYEKEDLEKQMDAFQIQEEEFFAQKVADSIFGIVHGIREAHFDDNTTAPRINIQHLIGGIESYMNLVVEPNVNDMFESICEDYGINPDALSYQQTEAFKEVLKKSIFLTKGRRGKNSSGNVGDT